MTWPSLCYRMGAMSLTSDPHAWLRSFYARLQSDPLFQRLVPSHRFAILMEAVEVDHPSQAAKMREWSSAAQNALVGHLAVSLADPPKHAAVSELWQATKGARVLRCVAQYLPSGIDLRLLEGEGFRRTQLCRDAPEVEALSARWRSALRDRDWQSC